MDPTGRSHVVVWSVGNHVRDGRCLRRLGVDRTRSLSAPRVPFCVLSQALPCSNAEKTRRDFSTALFTLLLMVLDATSGCLPVDGHFNKGWRNDQFYPDKLPSERYCGPRRRARIRIARAMPPLLCDTLVWWRLFCINVTACDVA